jgi:hypothetical protein
MYIYERDSESKSIAGIFSLYDWQHCWGLFMLYSRSDCDMLQVSFSCSPFVPSEHDWKMTAPLRVFTTGKQHAIVHAGAEIYQLTAEDGQNWLSQWSAYEQIKMFKSNWTSVIDTDR